MTRYDALRRNADPGRFASSDERDPLWERIFHFGVAERPGRPFPVILCPQPWRAVFPFRQPCSLR
jgi:hypothetical protein